MKRKRIDLSAGYAKPLSYYEIAVGDKQFHILCLPNFVRGILYNLEEKEFENAEEIVIKRSGIEILFDDGSFKEIAAHEYLEERKNEET